MALTAKPISTISYNTESFLTNKLDAFLASGKIEDYRFIFHQGEDGDKDHFHVLVYPNRRIDTVEFRETFKEVTPDCGDKPLGCMPFRSSKPDHWLMYVLHDELYLKSHKSDNDGDGKIPYSIEDISTPYPEQLIRDYRSAIRLRQTDSQKVLDSIRHGEKLTDIAYNNDINPTKVLALMNLMRLDAAMAETMNIEFEREKIRQEVEAKAIEDRNNATIMLRDLEEKTGEDLHTVKREDIFDE